MRKESLAIAEAFKAGKPCRKARTVCDGSIILLHGNVIASRNKDGSVNMTLANWPSVTTRDRLNTICRVLYGRAMFHQKNGVQYFNDEPISPRQIVTIGR